MFTGLIQALGKITNIVEHESSVELEINIGSLSAETAIGDSVSVNGVCLTITAIDSEIVTVDVMVQTLRLTSLKDLRIGNNVNLELAVLPTSRLGGHLVQGHVDGVGKVVVREPGERWERFVISIPSDLLKYVVAQGSITVDGVSLTVGSINDESSQIELWLIPETLAKTILGTLKVDDPVNIEVDVLAKYVERLLKKGEPS